MQIVNINDESAPCQNCKSDLAVLGTFKYTGITVNTARERNEQCVCKTCNQLFILHYDLYDKDGHINSFVFNEDVNDPTFKWQDQISEDQKKEIEAHLRGCSICRERLTDEMLSDAWLASVLRAFQKASL